MVSGKIQNASLGAGGGLMMREPGTAILRSP
jgi:hypothetical protein